MTESDVGGLLRAAIIVMLKMGGPPLVVSLVVGVVVALLQAITQINEAALAFVPKALALFVTLAMLGPFMYATLEHYAQLLFGQLVMLGSR